MCCLVTAHNLKSVGAGPKCGMQDEKHFSIKSLSTVGPLSLPNICQVNGCYVILSIIYTFLYHHRSTQQFTLTGKSPNCFSQSEQNKYCYNVKPKRRVTEELCLAGGREEERNRICFLFFGTQNRQKSNCVHRGYQGSAAVMGY